MRQRKNYGDTRLRAKLYPIRTTPAGGINTSIASFANWLRFHLGRGEFEGERLLSAELIRELQIPSVYIGVPNSPSLVVRIMVSASARRPIAESASWPTVAAGSAGVR